MLQAQFVAAISKERPAVLMVLHGSGGGTERHVRDLATHFRDEVTCVCLRVEHDGSAFLSILESCQNYRIRFYPSARLDELLDHLLSCNIQRVHIHHALGSRAFLRQLVHDLGKPFDFTIHDYLVISPQPHLVGDDDRFVGDCLQAAEQQLLRRSMSRETVLSLKRWQKEMEWLVLDAERVIAPSRDTARRIQAVHPQAKIRVVPHLDRPTDSCIVTRPPLRSGESMRIAVLGILSPHKGYRELLEAAKLVRRHQLPLGFTLIGFSHDDQTLMREGVNVTGPYDDPDLPTLLRNSASHLIWFASQCPETYSYTLTVGLRSDCCLAVPDLGAFPERVHGRQRTWVQRWNCTAPEWNTLFLSIREQLLTGQSEQVIDPPLTTYKSDQEFVFGDFYHLDYLAWKRGTTPEMR
jgi:glycosyltransferase involved in cell wall biosynthesis